MKLKPFETVVLIASAAVILFTAGFFMGKRHGRKEISVTVAPAAEETVVSEQTREAPQEPLQTETREEGLVNINTAGVEELSSLPGIGEALAGRIIEYREENGGFRYADEIMNVYGIGKSIYESIKDRITV